MSNADLSQFSGRQYLSIESFRKDGRGVRTPVWFAEGDGVYYVYTLADSYKIKRIRNNPRIRIAPCDARGGVKGEWVEATATILDENGERRAHELLNAKYGLIKRTLDLMSKLRQNKRAAIAIRVN
ncbi:MAG: PPOX class F420-dependent oxidoreductase [Acidobacteria bacterium]|nr:PPOX class F420-dependent oxidoreductase [Acidobacteriota bacterium]